MESIKKQSSKLGGHMRKHKKTVLIASVIIFLAAIISCCAVIYFDGRLPDGHQEYEIFLGTQKARWGFFDFSTRIPGEPTVRVEYLLPDDWNGKNTDIAFYAPFGNAKRSLERPQLSELTTAHNMLLFTIFFNYENQKRLPPGEAYWDHRSKWSAKVFEIQSMLEKHFDIPHRKLLIIGDFSGCRLAENMAVEFPDQVEAVALCSGSGYVDYPSAAHPPTLALSTWGDVGEMETGRFVMADCERGGYSLFVSVPPSWQDKSDMSYHHTCNDVGFRLARVFLAEIAELRNRNNNTLPPVSQWPASLNAVDYGSMPSPGVNFSELWNGYPENKLRELRRMEENESWELFEFSLSDSWRKKPIVVFLMTPEWRKEVWLLDNLYFFAENGRLALSRLLANNFDEYQSETAETIQQIIGNKKYHGKAIHIILGGLSFNALKTALKDIPAEEKSRIQRITFLNPPAVDPDFLSLFPQTEVITNAPGYKTTTNKAVSYVGSPGATFNADYYRILRHALK